jgi:hypothetical protein
MARALRKLSPNSALFRRRARGESLRNLARDYDVEHTSLSRYFRTEQGARRLRQAEQELEAKRARPESPPPPEPDPEPPRSTRCGGGVMGRDPSRHLATTYGIVG